MAQILVQISESMLADLERVAPGTTRKRSRFIQLAIQRALMELQDRKTREAYEAQPDAAAAFPDDVPWDEWKPKKAKKK